MNKSMKGKSAFISRKMIISFLFIVSILMTSSTFAYWADIVVGAEREISSSFVVGSPIWDDQEFVLNDNVNYIRYEVPVDMLLEDPTVNIDDLVFGITWDDLDLSDELEEKVSTGEVTLNYHLEIFRKGKEVNSNRYKRYSALIDVTVDESNPNELNYMDYPATFRMDITLTEENKRNDYKNLAKHDVYLVISYEVDYTAEYNYIDHLDEETLDLYEYVEEYLMDYYGYEDQDEIDEIIRQYFVKYGFIEDIYNENDDDDYDMYDYYAWRIHYQVQNDYDDYEDLYDNDDDDDDDDD